MGDTTFHRGDMDIREQRSTWDFFMGLTKWGSLAVAALLLLLTVWFCTPFGFGAGLISALILVVAGIFALRKREAPGAH